MVHKDAAAWPGVALLPVPPEALGLAALAASSDLVGGYYTLAHKRLQDPRYLIAFSSGIVVAASFFELIPESDVEHNAWLMAAGFFLFYLVEKAVMLHACGEAECESHHLTPVSAVGMAADNVTDGIGIAVGFLVSPMLGVIITLAVVAHEIPQGLTSAELLHRAGVGHKRIALFLLVAGLAYIAGALLSAFIPPALYHQTIAFVTGAFVYVGASDLLAEAHRRFNAGVIASVVAGAALMTLLAQLEGLAV